MTWGYLSLVLILIISFCSGNTQAKEINSTINTETSTIGDNLTSTSLPDNKWAKEINSTINTETSTIVDNSTSTSLLDNKWLNIATWKSLIDKIYHSLPTWAWILIGSTLALVLSCLCCCPQTLGKILASPFWLAFKIIMLILLPVRCCLSCLGFDKIGVRARSVASGFQSCFYGGHTPSGSGFSGLQSFTMR